MTMLAIVADRPGPPDVLRPVALPIPQPGPNTARIRVQAAGITFADVLTRRGSSAVPAATFPIVLGNSVGGIVDAVGIGVDPGILGTVAVAATGGSGGYASHAIVDAHAIHPIPGDLSIDTATSLLADGRTALGLYRAAQVRARQTVLVTAAAGGVGGLLIQLAKRFGAEVIALASSRSKLDEARGLGADLTVNYRQPGWEDALKGATRVVDVVFDGVGAGIAEQLLPVIARGGRYGSYGAAGGSWNMLDQRRLGERDIHTFGLGALANMDHFALVEDAFDLARDGLCVRIGQRFPLVLAAQAHTLIESRLAIGKTILEP